MATLHLGAGNRARAEPLLEQALQLDPELALAHHHLGLLRLAQDDTAGAEQAFRRALGLDPADVDSRLNLGLLLARRGRVGEARPLLEAALRQAPRSVYGAQLDEVRSWLKRTANPAVR
jgi:Tfp pilus assembly protein PilF